MNREHAEVDMVGPFERERVMVHHREHYGVKARIAMDLVERWGLVAANNDGEDSSGRAKLRLQTPAELVERACATADLLVEELRKRDWVTPLPSLHELQVEHQRRQAALEAESEARRKARGEAKIIQLQANRTEG